MDDQAKQESSQDRDSSFSELSLTRLSVSLATQETMETQEVDPRKDDKTELMNWFRSEMKREFKEMLQETFQGSALSGPALEQQRDPDLVGKMNPQAVLDPLLGPNKERELDLPLEHVVLSWKAGR